MELSRRKKAIAVIMTLSIAVIITVSLNTLPKVYNPPVTGEIQVPQNVRQIFERACYDCHSNETSLEWYDKLPVVAAIVSRDVKEARSRFNFSEWSKLSPADQAGTLWEIYNKVNAGDMPLQSYRLTHPQAKVSKQELAILKNYVNTLEVSHIVDERGEQQAIHERDIQRKEPHAPIPVSPNGVKHYPEYRSWRVMSTTSRFDNGTMRVMYANPIAWKALKDKNINPWPKGSVIAKVVWQKLEDSDGNVRQGRFINIQYMVKDNEKFKDTEGWGFAKFETPALKPAGTLASFRTCINCHQVVKQNGFVFDISTRY